MADYVNVPGSYSGTSGNDTFLYNGVVPDAYVDALGGFDNLTLDASGLLSVNSLYIGDDANSGVFTVNLNRFGGTVHFANIEAAIVKGTASDDRFTLVVRPASAGLAADLDGGAGNNSLTLFSDLPGPFSFVVDGDGTIHSSFGTFARFQQFSITTTASSSSIHTAAGNDEIYAAGAVDIATGAGDDTINAVSRSTDGHLTPAPTTGTIDGGDGVDKLTATFADGANPVTLTIDSTTLTASTGLIATHIERFDLKTGDGDDTITITSGADIVINAGAGDNRLVYSIATGVAQSFDFTTVVGNSTTAFYGFAGATSFQGIERLDLRGGSGNDTFHVSGAYDGASLALDGAGGSDLLIGDFAGQSGASTFTVAGDGTITSNRGQFSGLERFQLTGGSSADVFTTGAGDDTIDGGTGDDILSGGAGNDTYTVRSSNAQVIEAANAGIDTVIAYASFTLGANVENLTLIGDAGTAIDGTGNDLANVITGTNGPNVLRGMGGDDVLIAGAGADVLDGGTGTDTVDYSTSNAGVTVNLITNAVSGGAAQGDSITGIESVRGSIFADTLIGSDGVNALDGQAGNDLLTGGLGADTLTGGAGADVFRDTAAGLNGDTITDLTSGDRITITDASLATFSLSLSGHTLTYTGGTLTLGTLPRGALYAAAGANGGVDILVRAPVVASARNDFDGDGRSDILWRNSNGQLSDWLGTTNGGFILNDPNAKTSAPVSWQVVGTGDFNGDGRADILWRNSNGQLSDWLGKANGGFILNDANALVSVGTDWHVVGTGDINGDGRVDILWRSDGGQLSDWLGQANGSFINNDAKAFTTAPTSWTVAGTGDFNGDGLTDILWRNDNGQLSDWLAQADGGFTNNDANAFTNVSTNWHVAGTGDFDGDGRADILWRSDSGQLSNWLGQANGGFVTNDAHAFTTVSTNWHVVDTGDYNGDGRTDILWRSDAGQLSDWLANADGSFTNNDANAFANGDTNWVTQPIHDLIV